MNGGLGLLTPACHDMMKSANLIHKCGLGDFDMNSTVNSGVKNMYFFHVRNIEGRNSSEHTV